MKYRLSLIVSIFVLSFLAACSQGNTPTAASTQQSGYPAPAKATAYPAPNDATNPTAAVKTNPSATSDSTKGTVTGVLLLNGKPVNRQNLYLGGVITNDKGKEIVASMNQQKDPNSLTDEKGTFTFVNVPPGRYAIVLDSVTTAALLLNPKGTEAMLLTVKAGDKIDLGNLNYSNLPVINP